MSRNYRGDSSSCYRDRDRERVRDRDRDYNYKYRNYDYRDDRRFSSSHRTRDISPTTPEPWELDDRNDRYYKDRYHGDSYHSVRNHDRYNDKDRDRYDRSYSHERYCSSSTFRGGSNGRYSKSYYSSYRDDNDKDKDVDKNNDRYDDGRYNRDRYKDKFSRDKYRYNKRDKSPADSYKPNKRYHNDLYKNDSSPADTMRKEDIVVKNVIPDTPPLPTTDPHFPDAHEPTENPVHGSGYASDSSKPIDDHRADPLYKNYTSALLAGTSIKTGMYLGSAQKLLFSKQPIDALKSSVSNNAYSNTIASTAKPSYISYDNLSIVDPRNRDVIGKRVFSLFDCVKLPSSHRVATSLESPVIDFFIDGQELCRSMHDHEFIVSPLVKLNCNLYHKLPPVTFEKWVPGCVTLSIIGIPRHLTSQEALKLLVEVYIKSQQYNGCNIIYDDDWLTDEEAITSDSSNVYIKREGNQGDYSFAGVAEFHLLFGDLNKAKNLLDTNYPQSLWKSATTCYDASSINIPEYPDAMGLLVFYNESFAKDFWIAINSCATQVHSCIIQCFPDPLGLRIFAEALASSFNPDLLFKRKSNSRFQQHNIKREFSDSINSMIKMENNVKVKFSGVCVSSIYCWKKGEPSTSKDCEIISERVSETGKSFVFIKNEPEYINPSGSSSKSLAGNIKSEVDWKPETASNTVVKQEKYMDSLGNNTMNLNNNVSIDTFSCNRTFVSPLINSHNDNVDQLVNSLKSLGFRAEKSVDYPLISFVNYNENSFINHCIHNRVYYTPDDDRILCVFLKFKDSIIPLVQKQCIIKFTCSVT